MAVTHYINTDLELGATFDLRNLTAVLQKSGLFALQVRDRVGGVWQATLESELCNETEPTADISIILDVIESLEGAALDQWNACERRILNIGFGGGDEPFASEYWVDAPTLGRMAVVGLRLAITIYAVSKPK